MRPYVRATGLTLAALVMASGAAAAQQPAILAGEQFDVDGMHSSVGFMVTMLHFIKVRGRFLQYDVAMTYDSLHLERSSVTAVIASRSLTTDMNFRDNHLKSPDFFDVATFPTIEFHSERIVRIGPNRVRVMGPLTMHGITRPIGFVALVTAVPRLGNDGTDGVALETTLRRRRSDFGIAGTNKFNPSFNPATNLVSDGVTITIELSMQRQGYRDRRLGDLARYLGGGTPPGVVDTVSRVLEARGIAAAVGAYQALRTDQPTAFNYGVGQLDILGHVLIAHGRLPEAITIFRLNAEMYPSSDLALEALAQAQALSGDGPGALITFRRAAAAEPLSASAPEMIRRLGAGG